MDTYHADYQHQIDYLNRQRYLASINIKTYISKIGHNSCSKNAEIKIKHIKTNPQIQKWYPKNSTFQILILQELPFLFV